MITPSSPPGASTGTDQELATLADLASSVNGPQVVPACTFSSMTGACPAAASPTGPPAGPQGSRDQACSSRGASPSDAAQTSDASSSRWMHSRSLPSAAPSADRISVRLLDGSADTSRPVSPCSRISCRRADESTSCPDTSATTSSGCTSLGDTSAMTRPCRSTTMRSASRNICAVSWQASSTVVPCSRTRMMSSSTSPDSCTPSDAVGSSSSSSRGWCTMARATATIWRCPPDSDRTERSGSCNGTPSRWKMRAASRRNRMSDSNWPRRSRPSSTFEATSRFSHSDRSCQTTEMPRRLAAIGSAGTARPSSTIAPEVGAMSPAMQRTSVLLPAPFSPASATSSPARTVRSTESSAVSRPNRTPSPDTASCAAATVLAGLAGLAGAFMRTLWSEPPLSTTCSGPDQG